MPADLAALWPTLSAQEKDARVAEALWWKVAWQGLTAESRMPYIPRPCGEFVGPLPSCASWEQAGAREGWVETEDDGDEELCPICSGDGGWLCPYWNARA